MEILQKEGKVEYSISGRQAVYKSNPGTVIVCRNRGASEQEKIQYIKHLHFQFTCNFQSQFCQRIPAFPWRESAKHRLKLARFANNRLKLTKHRLTLAQPRGFRFTVKAQRIYT